MSETGQKRNADSKFMHAKMKDVCGKKVKCISVGCIKSKDETIEKEEVLKTWSEYVEDLFKDDRGQPVKKGKRCRAEIRSLLNPHAVYNSSLALCVFVVAVILLTAYNVTTVLNLSPEEQSNKALQKFSLPRYYREISSQTQVRDRIFSHSPMTQVAQDLGVAASHWAKFVSLCGMFTPINFCAESARLEKSEMCFSTPCALESEDASKGDFPKIFITKEAVENSIRKGVGLNEVSTLSKQIHLTENGIFFKPASFIPSSTNYSRAENDRKNVTEPPNVVPITSTIAEQHLEAYVPYIHETFFEGREHNDINHEERKIILWYSPARYTPQTVGLQPLQACPNFPCLITREKKYANKSSAMIFAGKEKDLVKIKDSKNFLFIHTFTEK
ncbi:hypothetical protein PoB_003202700 [Plakobranchus ocellatus]|uniref:Uncharacterized protein n=1 Tax=Plakobranchus ocellatus TaxID=259542 RepID=A0AAV4AEU8_9GAST|nr:hypothetical protein PoB_003202700 [Plakobranchus ocellatus]